MSLLPVTSAQSTERQQRRTGAAEVLLVMSVLWRTVLEGEVLLTMSILWRTVLEVEVLLAMLLLLEPVVEVEELLEKMLLPWWPGVEVEELLEKILLLWWPGVDGQEVELREQGQLDLAARCPARTVVRRAAIPKTGEERMPARLETLHQTNQHRATAVMPPGQHLHPDGEGPLLVRPLPQRLGPDCFLHDSLLECQAQRQAHPLKLTPQEAPVSSPRRGGQDLAEFETARPPGLNPASPPNRQFPDLSSPECHHLWPQPPRLHLWHHGSGLLLTQAAPVPGCVCSLLGRCSEGVLTMWGSLCHLLVVRVTAGHCPLLLCSPCFSSAEK